MSKQFRLENLLLLVLSRFNSPRSGVWVSLSDKESLKGAPYGRYHKKCEYKFHKRGVNPFSSLIYKYIHVYTCMYTYMYGKYRKNLNKVFIDPQYFSKLVCAGVF